MTNLERRKHDRLRGAVGLCGTQKYLSAEVTHSKRLVLSMPGDTQGSCGRQEEALRDNLLFIFCKEFSEKIRPNPEQKSEFVDVSSAYKKKTRIRVFPLYIRDLSYAYFCLIN